MMMFTGNKTTKKIHATLPDDNIACCWGKIKIQNAKF